MATFHQRLVVLLLSMHLLVTCVLAIPSPATASAAAAKHDDGAKPTLDSDTGDDRELKSDDDGYDFFMIDQLFLNNPQYRQLISDLQAHTFGSNWRRKRDVSDSELPDAFRGEITEPPRTSTSVPSSSTTSSSSSTPVTSTTTSNVPTSGTSVSAAATAPLDIESNRDITSSSTNLPKAAALTSTKADVSTKSSSTTNGGTTTPLVTSTPSRGSTVSTSASYGSSGSTEPPTARNATLEMTTAAAPIRASTPRRLSHKNGSNKNKNKLSSTTNKPTSIPVGPNAVNVNKVSVSSNAVASSSSSSGSNAGSTPALQADAPVAIPATENGTSAGLAGNNKDKVGQP
ncbi:putative protein TPRXL [Anopheles darlingi]|uniref:putative protein TPRXL n=1 Tax=Anopheles darlingi TaxID=43151 RepID=UPI0021003F5D|nr:putative protein TPRXL [Anopheles darlingi]